MGNNRYEISEPIAKRTDEAGLLYISSATYGGDWESTPHSHQCTELFYVVGGAGGFKIENKTVPVHTHDLIVVNPNVQHTEVSLNDEPLRYIVLGVRGLEVFDPQNAEDRYFVLNFEKRGDRVLNCLQMMMQEVEAKLPGYDSVCRNLLQVILVLLMREAHVTPEQTIQATRRECATAKWYIDNHFKEKITLDLLAQVAGVNKYHLAHTFTQEYGVSPIRYLTERRITESKYLLNSTDIPINSIVQSLSFSSASYFAQMFRRSEGISPSEYRNCYRAK